MDDKDPSPFGYTFSPGFFQPPTSDFHNGGPSLLSDMEAQQLDSFFSHTNPFGSEATASTFHFPSEAPELIDDFTAWQTVPPATIHDISTTIPDQSLLHGFNSDHSFAPTQQSSQFPTAADHLQAASTLYSQSQLPVSMPSYQPNGRSYSFGGIPTNGHGLNGLNHAPLVPNSAGPNGLTREQMNSLVPDHNGHVSTHGDISAQYTNGTARTKVKAEQLDPSRPALKRSYTYGTDSSFHESGFQPASRHESEAHVTNRMLSQLQHAARPIPTTAPGNSSGHLVQHSGQMYLPPKTEESESNEDRVSEESSAGDNDENRRKKRRTRSSPIKNGKRKSISVANPGKNRKASVDDRVKKPRSKSIAGSKQQRENLTEEQKRNNHILSEQKRRNLIKRGFDDLHDLVPEIRNGGLSKSGVLTEAANFLEQLIQDNQRYAALLAGD